MSPECWTESNYYHHRPPNKSITSVSLFTYIYTSKGHKGEVLCQFRRLYGNNFHAIMGSNFLLLFLRRVFFITDTRPEPRPSRQRSALSVIQHSTHVWTSRLTPYKRARPQLSNSARHTSAR